MLQDTLNSNRIVSEGLRIARETVVTLVMTAVIGAIANWAGVFPNFHTEDITYTTGLARSSDDTQVAWFRLSNTGDKTSGGVTVDLLLTGPHASKFALMPKIPGDSGYFMMDHLDRQHFIWNIRTVDPGSTLFVKLDGAWPFEIVVDEIRVLIARDVASSRDG